MKRAVLVIMALCLLLSGCSEWMSSSYHSVQSHTDLAQTEDRPVLTVSSYSQLSKALISLIREGTSRGVLSVQYAEEEETCADMDRAIEEICRENPFAIYAVEKIDYDCGSDSSGKTVSVKITYLQDRAQADQIQRIQDTDQIQRLIAQQLENCEEGVVLYVDNPELVDYAQMVEDYALDNPQTVMEIPAVTVSRYPEQGQQRIIELKFTYQTNRDELRAMHSKVDPVFASALQHSTGNWTAEEKLNRLYSFLMERYDEYRIEASATPAYSLLLHGTGDCRAFAMVYGAMCRQAGINSGVILGAYNGEPWAWNAVKVGGQYYYIDLLRCSQERKFTLRTLEEMTDYVWDYSIYALEE